MADVFDTSFEELPTEIPVFPLPRVMLLPRVQLPLNIFEPRYLAMVDHAMKRDRLIGMIQPRDGDMLYKTGCAGRIVSFSETEDGRYLITLKGVCRFDIAQERPLAPQGFRLVQSDWKPYEADLVAEPSTEFCRDTMMNSLRGYLDKMNMFCDKWETMRDIDCEKLISTLSVVCPFKAEEKQALLEARTTAERVRLLQALFDICAHEEKKGACH